ncbi:hypothetical protein SARC_06240 [Sphaeroforma arctica JP610]|uniref:Uncharacterized protein n=1 Tax=Sphaeroforma arctica JP610 TaxID=667725 RepID=A0A0L0FXP6_9EUKA|nr:hypothetical protein SARC_06240 [Sphaeroforma arctica JP610]KNC81424.1 hypothetical protein SARC_06240 [Sphaeroforma arctica JP610]|eukprot:XP_014155326.1 hypothetical protein SARC_06240 [Sphaeroforma arctica JP610]
MSSISWTFERSRMNTVTGSILGYGIELVECGKHVIDIGSLVQGNRVRELSYTKTDKMTSQTEVLHKVGSAKDPGQPFVHPGESLNSRNNLIDVDDEDDFIISVLPNGFISGRSFEIDGFKLCGDVDVPKATSLTETIEATLESEYMPGRVVTKVHTAGRGMH